MAGNKNSGRKKKVIPSVQYRFQMPGKLDKALAKYAKQKGTDKVACIKQLIARETGTEFY